MNINYMLIGNRIKQQRKFCGKTQEKMAEELAVSVGYISQIERGITKPNLELLGRLSILLNCDISYFISDTIISKNEYLNNEFIKKFNILRNNEKDIVLDLINSLISNR